MNWISVKDKMPDMPPDEEGFPVSRTVLTYCSDGWIGVQHVAIYDDKAEWYSEDGFSAISVTHWMPLPRPPVAG